LLGETPQQAVGSYVSQIQRALSCITTSVLSRRRDYTPERLQALTIGTDDGRVRLGGESRLSLSFTQHYRIVRASADQGILWSVAVVGYEYAYDDADGREIIAYHWHPEGRSLVGTPHLHLGYGAGVARLELQRTHLPTGMVSIEQVLHLGIEDLGVRTRRADWRSVLV
jgi:hypothetical protein